MARLKKEFPKYKGQKAADYIRAKISNGILQKRSTDMNAWRYYTWFGSSIPLKSLSLVELYEAYHHFSPAEKGIIDAEPISDSTKGDCLGYEGLGTYNFGFKDSDELRNVVLSGAYHWRPAMEKSKFFAANITDAPSYEKYGPFITKPHGIFDDSKAMAYFFEHCS